MLRARRMRRRVMVISFRVISTTIIFLKSTVHKGWPPAHHCSPDALPLHFMLHPKRAPARTGPDPQHAEGAQGTALTARGGHTTQFTKGPAWATIDGLGPQAIAVGPSPTTDRQL